jgi:hypothetical protein
MVGLVLIEELEIKTIIKIYIYHDKALFMMRPVAKALLNVTVTPDQHYIWRGNTNDTLVECS